MLMFYMNDSIPIEMYLADNLPLYIMLGCSCSNSNNIFKQVKFAAKVRNVYLLFIKVVRTWFQVLPEITSLGLNEQELAFAAEVAGGPYGNQAEHKGQPLIHEMSDIILWLLGKYGKSSKNPTSRLTRVHFHSLTYHIVGAHRSHWSNIMSATMAGTRIAGMQACDVQDPDPDIVDLRIPLEFQLFSGDNKRRFDPETSTYTWTIGDYNFVFSPVLVCKQPVKTVGLGDAISATGLMFSQFIP